jgi:hypothetical protein
MDGPAANGEVLRQAAIAPPLAVQFGQFLQRRGPAEGKALAAIHNYHGDLLLIEAEKDEAVHPQVMRSFRNATLTNYDYALIPGSDHGMKTQGANEARIKVLNEWFAKIAAR